MIDISHLTKIRVKNFQAIKDVELDLDSDGGGLYWIRGKNNIGKSALLKAVSALLTNVSNNKYKAFLRDNTTTFTVKGWFGRDWVELSRGAEDYYEWCIDGEVFRVDKTGGKVPDELVNYYDLYYEPEKTKRYLNITGADEPLLFVSTTGGDNDRLFQKALGTEDITNASKEADKLRRLQASQRKTIHNLLDERTAQVEPMKGVYNRTLEDFTRIEELEQVMDTEYGVYKKITEQCEEVDIYTQLATHYIGILEVEDLVKESNLAVEFTVQDIVRSHLEELGLYHELESHYQGLPQVDAGDLDGVAHLLQQVTKLKEVNQQLTHQAQLETQLANIDESLMTDYLEAQEWVKQLQLIKQHKQAIEAYDERAIQLAQATAKLAELEASYEEARSALGICPYCSSKLSESHTH